MKRKIAIVFDADDTLFETSSKYIKAKNEFIQLLEKTVKEKNLFSSDDFKRKHLERFQIIDSDRVKTFKLDKNRFVESMIIYTSLIFGHYHVKWDCEVEMEIKKIASQVFEMPQIYSETQTVLEDLYKKEFHLYCLTAGDKEIQNNKFDSLLEAGWDIKQYLRYIIVVPMKEDLIYKTFKESFAGYDEYVMIGDNVKMDVLPSLRQGFSCIWLKKDHLVNHNWNGTEEVPLDNPKLTVVKTLEEAHKVILEKFSI